MLSTSIYWLFPLMFETAFLTESGIHSFSKQAGHCFPVLRCICMSPISPHPDGHTDAKDLSLGPRGFAAITHQLSCVPSFSSFIIYFWVFVLISFCMEFTLDHCIYIILVYHLPSNFFLFPASLQNPWCILLYSIVTCMYKCAYVCVHICACVFTTSWVSPCNLLYIHTYYLQSWSWSNFC